MIVEQQYLKQMIVEQSYLKRILHVLFSAIHGAVLPSSGSGASTQ